MPAISLHCGTSLSEVALLRQVMKNICPYCAFFLHTWANSVFFFLDCRITLWTSMVCSNQYSALSIFYLGKHQHVAVCLRHQKLVRHITSRCRIMDSAYSHPCFGSSFISIYTLTTAGKKERKGIFCSLLLHLLIYWVGCGIQCKYQ